MSVNNYTTVLWPNRRGVVLTGGMVTVDPVNGSDSSGTRGNMGKPFATLTGAKNAAVSGDTIVVLPGTYHENNLLKDGVNWFFYPGAVVDYTAPGVAVGVVASAGANNDIGFTSKARGADQNGIVILYVDDGSQVANTASASYDAVARKVTVKVKAGTTQAGTIINEVNAGVNAASLPVIAGLAGGAGGSGAGTVANGDTATLAGGVGTVTSTANYGIFDDRGGAVTCSVAGEGEFVVRDTLKNTDLLALTADAFGLVYLSKALTTFRLKARKVSGSAWLSAIANLLTVTNCKASYLEVTELADVNYDQTHATDFGSAGGGIDNSLATAALGMVWVAGETYFRFDRLVMGVNYGIWAGQNLDAAANTNLWVEGNYLEGGASMYWSEGVSANWRTWVHVKEMVSNGGGACNFISGGKHYLQVDKMVSTGFAGLDINSYTGHVPTVWANIQKMSASSADIFKIRDGQIFAEVLQFEDLGGATSAINILGGELHLTGGYAKVLNGKGMIHSGGTADINGLKLDTTGTNNANNVAVSVSAAGLVLRGCVLLSPALADSVKGDAARTITNYGSVANKAKNANITVNVQAILVDANVV